MTKRKKKEKKCEDCPINAKCMCCPVMMAWVKEMREKNERNYSQLIN